MPTDLDAAPSRNEEVVRMTLEVAAADRDLFAGYAAYRNMLADVRGKMLRARWSSKNTAEHLLALQAGELRGQLKEMFEALGPFPDMVKGDKKSEKEMRDYVQRALDWSATAAAILKRSNK